MKLTDTDAYTNTSTVRNTNTDVVAIGATHIKALSVWGWLGNLPSGSSTPGEL